MIKNTRGQFVAVTVVLVVGLIFYIAMSVSAVNLDQSMKNFYETYHFADLSCSVDQVTQQQIRKIEAISGIIAAEGRIIETAPFLTGDKNERVKVKVVTIKENEQEVNQLCLLEGDMLGENSREVLVIQQFAVARNIVPGDQIALQIKGVEMKFSVAGIVCSPEFVYLVEDNQSFLPDDANYGVVFIQEEFAQSIFGFLGSYNDIQMKTSSGMTEKQADDVIEKIEDVLDQYGSTGVVKRENQFSNALLQSEVDQLKRMASALPILFLGIAALILAMMIGRMVKRDRQAIGIMKALGYSSFSIISHYVKYALLVGMIGGIIGAIIGMVVADQLGSFYGTFFHIPEFGQTRQYGYMFAAIFLACLFCMIAGLFGGRGIIKISPAESMSAESPKRGKRILVERITFLWKRFSFSEKMAMKNVFRNKKRTVFILAGVSLTFSMLVFVLSMPLMISDMMGDGLREFQQMDYNVNFSRPIGKDAIQDVYAILDGVTELEGKVELPFQLANGTKEIALSVIGIQQDSVFYSFKNREGKVVNLGDSGILISDYVAKSLEVGIGDKIKIQSYLYDQDEQWMEVGGVVYQAMGTNAYIDMDYLLKEYFSSDFLTGCYLNTTDPDAVEKLLELPMVSSVTSLETTIQVFQEYTGLINVAILFMLVLCGILGFAIVYNATIISIGERETEFSSLRVLGFSRWEIFLLIIRENNIITIAGLILGIPLTQAFLQYSSAIFSTEQYTMNVRADLLTWAGGAFMTVLFIVLAQTATYRKIHKLDFLMALKNRA